ncbi:MAG: HAD family hydrolase [Chloroflexi bacterium]|nr:HAD family hydrolase [Chloroflexota bacterium]
MIKGVIFDLGWTLTTYDADWNIVNQSAYSKVAAYLNAKGFTVPDNFSALFQSARERGWKRADETGVEQTVEDALRQVYASLGVPSMDGVASQAVRVFFEDHESHWVAYPDALPTIKELAKLGLRIGLISNADDIDLVHRQVDQSGFRPYLSPVLSSASEPRWRKPDPRIFHLVSDRWNLSPSEIVMVGDSPMYDVLGAHRANMKAIWINRNEGRAWQKIPDALANDPAVHADAVVRSLIEIPKLVGNW